jgi:predicted transcriptional regulator
MARKKSLIITDAELKLMNILWKNGSGTVTEVMSELPSDNPLAYSTVLTFMRILEQKGFTKHDKRGRAFVYYPIVDRSEATKNVIGYVVNRFFDDSPGQMAMNVISNEKISAGDLKELKKLIDGKK